MASIPETLPTALNDARKPAPLPLLVQKVLNATTPVETYRECSYQMDGDPQRLVAFQLAVRLGALKKLNNQIPRFSAYLAVLNAIREEAPNLDLRANAPAILVEEIFQASDPLLAYRKATAAVELRDPNGVPAFRRMVSNRLGELAAKGTATQQQDRKLLFMLVSDELSRESVSV